MSRIEAARRKVEIAKVGVAITALTAFAAFVAVARVSHPATHGTSASTSVASTSADESPSSSFFGSGDDSSAIAPSYGSAPQVQSGAS